ncbi:MAG TPA: hypothetical protein VMS77_01010 [Conexivisphaerales archaeon]|nr:hypothetical protein [Conexivisphaerales archaeon]
MTFPVPLSILDDLMHLVSGNLGNIPSLVVMAVPLIIGLILGYVVKKALKVGLLLAAIALVAAYFGYINLGSTVSEIQSLVTKYGPMASSYASVFFGVVPLSIGLVIGFLLGFIFT